MESENAIFNILKERKKNEDENTKSFSLNVVEEIFRNVERIQILLKHNIFNEIEAAYFLRLPNPETEGRKTIRNYALRSKKLSYIKIGRNGLTFSRKNLEDFVQLLTHEQN